MGYFDILMKTNKMLVATNRINLRQHESLVDKIRFTVPFQYSDDINLSDFQVIFEWLDPTGVVHVDILVKEEEIYKDNYQRYFLPITSPINRYAGDVEGKLVFTKTDYETATRYKLDTESIIIPIATIKDYYAVIPDESFDAINDMIDKLQAQTDALNASAELFDQTKADNIAFNDDGDVQLKSHGEFIGNAISVAVPGTEDDQDKSHDGVIDADQIYDEITL